MTLDIKAARAVCGTRTKNGAVNSRLPLAERFWARVQKTESCWIWTGTVGGKHGGYGRMFKNGRNVMAHRVAYELLRGEVPSDMTIDHLCKNKRCVNPDHLEVVSRGENARRHMSAIPACKNGHPFDEVNTQRSGPRRHCRACRRFWDRQRKAKARENREAATHRSGQ